MRNRMRLTALLAALLIAALPLHAQQQPAPAEPSLPERVLDGVGEAIKGIFRAIFGPTEGELPRPQEPANEGQAKPEPPPPAAAPTPERAATPPPAVSATPSAQAAPQTLHSAIAKGEDAAALKLIEQGTDVEAKDPGAGASPLHYAVMMGKIKLVDVLLKRGADVNSRTKSRTTPLHTAVLYGRLEVAEYLIDSGAEVNAKSTSGTTPLSLALAANFRPIEKMLRRRGAQ